MNQTRSDPEPERRNRPRTLPAALRTAVLAGTALAVALLVGAGTPSGASPSPPSPAGSEPSPAGSEPSGTTPAANPDIPTRCPWLETAIDRGETPWQLAQTVLRRMTVTEKLGEMVLVSAGDYENFNAGVARLCIPPLTLQDGPQGLAFGAVHVTQLPAPLGVAATFDTSIARAYGQVQGSETLGQGIDVVQGPNLNIDRVPQSGRSYESFGEDPLLVSAMGVADIGASRTPVPWPWPSISPSTTRRRIAAQLDTVVSRSAPSRSSTSPLQGGGDRCPRLFRHVRLSPAERHLPVPGRVPAGGARPMGLHRLRPIRPRVGARPAGAIAAGTDLLKPANAVRLAALAGQPGLPLSEVDAAVARVLTAMFAHGLVGRPPEAPPTRWSTRPPMPPSP